MKEPLVELYALQQIDTEISRLKRRYAQLDNGREDSVLLQALTVTFQEAEKKLKEAQRNIADLELEANSIEEKRTREETRLYSGSVRNPKELKALQEEVESLGRRREKMGQERTLKFQELSLMRADLDEVTRKKNDCENRLKSKQTAFNSEAEGIVAEAKALMARRNNAVKEISPSLLKRYDTVRASREGLAIVLLEDDVSCGGCKMALPSANIRLIHEAQETIACDNCNRIVIFKPKE